MSDVLCADYVLSFDHAMKIIKKLKVKRHAALGFYYDLEDLNLDIWTCSYLYVEPKPGRLSDEDYNAFAKHVFGDYRGGVRAFRLRVYRPA